MMFYEGRYKVIAKGYLPVKGQGLFIVQNSEKLEEAKKYFIDTITKAINENYKEGFNCEVRFTSFNKIDIVMQY